MVLATDGIPGRYGAPPPEISELVDLIAGTPHTILQNFVKYAFTNGGEDNLGLVVSLT